jgi:hypothetical protein
MRSSGRPRPGSEMQMICQSRELFEDCNCLFRKTIEHSQVLPQFGVWCALSEFWRCVVGASLFARSAQPVRSALSSFPCAPLAPDLTCDISTQNKHVGSLRRVGTDTSDSSDTLVESHS